MSQNCEVQRETEVACRSKKRPTGAELTECRHRSRETVIRFKQKKDHTIIQDLMYSGCVLHHVLWRQLIKHQQISV